MAELKIKTNYTYETSDGREFDDANEAQEWQQALEDIKGVVMLDSGFNPTSESGATFYVHINNPAELKAFNLVQDYEGLCALPSYVGYWYYDEITDSFVDIDKEIERLQDMKRRLCI